MKPEFQYEPDPNYPQDPLTQWSLAVRRSRAAESMVRAALLDYQKGDWELVKRLTKKHRIARIHATIATEILRAATALKKRNEMISAIEQRGFNAEWTLMTNEVIEVYYEIYCKGN